MSPSGLSPALLGARPVANSTRSVETGLARKSAGERNRFEAGFEVDFHRRVRDGYLRLAAQEPERFAVIDASVDPDAVFSGIVAALGRLPDLAARLADLPSD